MHAPKKSHYEVFHGHPPKLDYIKVFGCLCYATKPLYTDKFSSKAIPSIFIGYATTQKGYKLYNISSDTFFISRDVTFREHIFPFQHPKSTFLTPDSLSSSHTFPSTSAFPHPLNVPLESHDHSLCNSSPSTSSSVPTPIISTTPILSPSPPLVRKSSSVTKPLLWHINYITQSKLSDATHPISNCLSYSAISPSYRAYLTAFSSSIPEPFFYTKAAQDKQWIFAMDQEIAALTDNHTWEIVDLPVGKTPIDCKWVYKVKYKADGSRADSTTLGA
ncbi:hypothetical protein KY284_013590 [Solanum tuberosum]|nr:hypothetical protein KY284_013590 [Solanum tuberosum]